MNGFDYLDTYYLANTLTAPELRHEARHAETQQKVVAFWEGTPYADENPFPWADYAGCCREALECIRLVPRPAVKGNYRRLDITVIKAGNDIVTTIERYTTLRKSGHDRFTGCCPLHEDRHPSLVVYGDSQSWRCYQCNRGGDIFSFVMAAESCEFKEAAVILGGTQ